MALQSIYNFGPAARHEEYVYGAARPGLGSHIVATNEVIVWCDFMRSHVAQAVCCLLTSEQLAIYQDLLGIYTNTFGDKHACWAPIADYTLISSETLAVQVLPFLRMHADHAMRTVIHCSAGSGRTGHVLALWLAHRYGLDNDSALAAVCDVADVVRDPLEAVTSGVERLKLDHLFITARAYIQAI